MTMQEKFYRCSKCGNLFGTIKDSGVVPFCCGEEMEEYVPNTSDGAVEKHLPVVSINHNVCHVEVGSVAHPMLAAHHIDWILVATNRGRHKITLKIDEPAVVNVPLGEDEEVLKVYANCNLHGLWVTEVKK